MSEWLKSAQTPFERRAAVKLLALLRFAEAHDLLAAEVREGPAREAALDGLVALARSPVSRRLRCRLMDDPAPPLEPDADQGRGRPAPARGSARPRVPARDLPLTTRAGRERRRCAGGSSCARRGEPVPRDCGAVLPELIEGVRLEPTDAGGIVELLTLSGMSDTDPVIRSSESPARSIAIRAGPSGRSAATSDQRRGGALHSPRAGQERSTQPSLRRLGTRPAHQRGPTSRCWAHGPTSIVRQIGSLIRPKRLDGTLGSTVMNASDSCDSVDDGRRRGEEVHHRGRVARRVEASRRTPRSRGSC